MSIRTSYLDLADFLGMSLEFKNGKVIGKGTVKQDWGLGRPHVKHSVFDSFVDKDTGVCFLSLALAGNLGILLDYDPVGCYVELALIDRDKLPDRGKNLFGDAFIMAHAADAVPASIIKLRAEGPVKGPLKEIKT